VRTSRLVTDRDGSELTLFNTARLSPGISSKLVQMAQGSLLKLASKSAGEQNINAAESSPAKREVACKD
jgi:hypothetical protein